MPASPSTWPTCSSCRTGWARAWAARCSPRCSMTRHDARPSRPTIRGRCRIYVRAGMTPLWPTLYVEGDATAPRRCRPGWTSSRLPRRSWPRWSWPGPAPTAATITGSGRPRPTRIRSSSWIGTARWRWRSAGRGRSPMSGSSTGCCVRPGADPVPPVLAALRRTDRGTRVVASLLGPSPVLPVLLDAGLPRGGPRPVHGERSRPHRPGAPPPEPRDALGPHGSTARSASTAARPFGVRA